MKVPTPKVWQHRPVRLRVALASWTALAALAPAALAAAPVSFDRHSLSVRGERVFLNGGEVHPYRMPAPRAWPVVLDRMRAAGLNEVSIYVPWQLHEPRPGEFRFDGRFDMERFLRDARDAGLYVVVRPGPYIQSEIDGGGFPAWLLGSPGVLRTVDPAYTAAWKRWFAEVMPRIARWEVGGPMDGTVVAVQVENEFPGDTEDGRAYMRDLVATAKANGVTVPITHNDVQLLGSQLSRGLFTDIVDVFGFDNYPYGFTCCPEWNEATFAQVDQFEDHYRSRGVTRSPLYTAEIQGGIAPIAGDDGRTLEQRHRALWDYEAVQSVSLLGQGLTFINRYMTYGGTSWGNLLFPNDGTSYDYAAPIREWTGLGRRYEDLHLNAMQVRAAGASIAATDPVTDHGVVADPPEALYRVRREAGSRTLHLFLRNADPAPARDVALTIGGRAVKPVFVPGHGARWLLVDAELSGWRLAFSTAEVLAANRRTLVLFGDPGQVYEAEVDGRRIEFAPSRRPQVVAFPGGRRVLILSRRVAGRTWLRRGSVVVGPYLVSDRVVETSRRTRVVVYGRRVTKTTLPGPPPGGVKLPVLRSWRTRDGTPEREPGFDDSGWTRADRQTTHNQMQPLTSPVLGSDDYGIPGSGFVWYRGRFDGSAEGVCIEGRHRYHLWLNGRSLGTVTSDAEVPGPSGLGGLGAYPPVNQQTTVRFPQEALRPEGNVLAVLVESWGHNMDAGAANQAKQVRGLVSASLERPGSPDCGFALGAGGETTVPYGSGTPQTLPAAPKPSGGIDWRLRGGSPFDYPNTSGLHGELAGWHEERFDDSAWQATELPVAEAAPPGQVTWLRTSFRLAVPRDLRAPVGLELDRGSFPAEVYLNGVHVARAGRSREERFYMPEGVLRRRGRNTLAIARWNVTGDRGMARPRLFAYEVTRTRPARRPLAPRR